MSPELIVSQTTVLRAQILPKLCIHELFELQASQLPNAVAVCCGGETLTYAELNARANRLAHYLKRLRVGPEVAVALCLERSLDLVVAILAVLKAGGVYVPVDLAYPKERVSFMLEDAQAPVLLTQQSLRAALPTNGTTAVCIDSQWPEISKESAENPTTFLSGENGAYIIYTSGSTGTPKGVLVTHENVTRLFSQTEQWYHFSPTDVWTLFHSYAFDFSVWEIWGALFYGGRLVVVPYEVSRSPGAFYELLGRERVTVLNQTPSAFRQLMRAEAAVAASQATALRLRYVIFGGEALELQSLKPWFERHGDERPLLVNMYGITETTVHVTYRPLRKADLAKGLGSVIGVPIPDLQLYLLDENLKPVPTGSPGELCVGGAGVARGYLNRPGLNQQRFPLDPYSPKPGARLYRSGDLARYTPGGELEYLGRIDTQVKIRGFRVELGEIESALNQHPAVSESVVVAQAGPDGDKRLVAYVVTAGTAPSVTALREGLRKRIPDYMVPAVFVFMKSMPLTASGKIDRQALPAPDGARPELSEQYLAPRSPAERALAEIWSEVLEIRNIGVQDNFFELGGDSIRSIRVLGRAQQRGFRLSLQQLFQNPTIAALALCAKTADATSAAPATLPFSLLAPEDRSKLPEDVEDAYPLTQLQMGMFYHNELNPASAIYHDVFSFRFQCALDRAKLELAANRLLQRHPVLRTSFHLAQFSEPLQVVHRQVKAPFTVEDLSQGTRESQEQKLIEWLEAEKRRPFDRSVAPLMRFHVQVHGADSFQFIASFHHVCLDGWSLAAMLTELFQEYAALREGTAPALETPRIPYRDFVALEKSAMGSEECRRFWLGKLEGATFQLLPRWPEAMRAGGHEQVRGPELQVDPTTFAGLKQLARTAGVPLKSVLLAAHQRVMGLLYGQTDVTSGLVCNGRPEEADGEKMIGLFLNTLPLRQQLEGGTWRELAQQAFAAEQELIPFRRFPLAEIQKLTGGQALFESAFDFVHFHVYQSLQGCQNLGFMEGHYFEANNLTTYTTFMLDVTSTQLQLHIDYDPKALCRKQVEQITGYYENTLKAMAADPHGRHERFSPLSEPERQQLLVEWNATDEAYPSNQCLHELFETRARETPEAIALVCGERELSYGELNRQADRLACRLAELGVGPDVLAGVCLERSPEMVIALLGVLKAGGAYVPLDPAFPRERLAWMLEDAQVRVLVTEQKLLDRLPKTQAAVLPVEAISARNGATQGEPRRLSTVGPANLAYVIYTSGSTGKPKGVQVIHRAVVNLLTSAAKVTRFTAREVLLAVTTLSFDIAALELFLPLMKGAQLTLASREQAADGTQLADLISRSGATVMQATPATWRLLLESGWPGNQSLRVLCGGEALSRSLADDLLQRVREVWNFYGPTETTIWSTAWKVIPGQPVSIGRPLANTQAYILDGERQLAPVGTAGHLYLGGAGVARGYWNRPELTAEKFIPNPFAPGANCRMYNTGDLARYMPDGTIECLGRTDYQVKIRGFRIEPGEVEAVLREHPGIADALVTAREDALGGKQLIGYIVSRNGSLATTELREFAKSKLPSYMVPAQLVVLKELPRTPNGKVDLRRLPAPEAGCEAPRSYLAPRNELEARLAEVWREVLMVKQVGARDDFFELGADSLSATRAFARINKLFGTHIRLAEVFEHPTVAALAAIVRQHSNGASPHALAIPRRSRASQPRKASGG